MTTMPAGTVTQLRINVTKDDIIEALAEEHFALIKKDVEAKQAESNNLHSEYSTLKRTLDSMLLDLVNKAVENEASDVIAVMKKYGVRCVVFANQPTHDSEKRSVKGDLVVNVNSGSAHIHLNKSVEVKYTSDINKLMDQTNELQIKVNRLNEAVRNLQCECSPQTVMAFKTALKTRIVKQAMKIANGDLQKLLSEEKEENVKAKD